MFKLDLDNAHRGRQECSREWGEDTVVCIASKVPYAHKAKGVYCTADANPNEDKTV